jgi:AcrR family transcriptional regulator
VTDKGAKKARKRPALADRAKRGLSAKRRGTGAKSKRHDDKEASKGPARRVPTQERSRKRFEKIVAVAADAFAAQGFDATKMEAIASEAGTSIGSVYQFFANKRSLFGAVAQRCLERSREAFASRLSPEAIARPWRELLDEMVDTFAVLHRQDPAFRAVMANIQLYEDYAEADQAMMQEFTQTTAAIIGVWAPGVETARRSVMASIVVNTIGAFLVTSSRTDALPFDALLAELKLMLVRYLEPELARSANRA